MKVMTIFTIGHSNRAIDQSLAHASILTSSVRTSPPALKNPHDTPAQFTIAFVDVNVAGDLMQFAETVALNRSLPAAAEEWLRAQ